MLIAISSVPLFGVFRQSGGHNVVIGTQVESILADYVLAAPILVTADDEFNTTVWSGSGTEVDPYVVENLNITTDADCAKVTNTTKHFEIRNCFFASVSTPAMYGVQLRNVTNGAIKNCIIRQKSSGIVCEELNDSIISENTVFNCSTGIGTGLISNVTISRNTAYNNWNGMQFYLAINSDVVYNTVFNCTFSGVQLGYGLSNSRFAHNTIHSIKGIHSIESGIQMWFSSGWIVEENILYDNHCSIDMVIVENCLIRNNDISNSSNGIVALTINSNVFDGNAFSDCGSTMSFFECNDCVLSENALSDCRSAMYFRDCNDCVLSENALSDIDYRGMEILDSTEFNVTGNSLDRCGITIDGLTVLNWKHVVIDNTVNGKELGYFVDESDMVVDGTMYGAVYLVNCDGVTVQNGEFHNGSMGVCIAFSDHCEVVDCEVQGQLYGGIRLFYSEDCVLERNIIYNNSRFWREYGGIDLGFVANCKITGNRIYWNQQSGISDHPGMTAINCTIANNAIYNNSGYGISIRGYDNTIYGNAIGWNEEGNAIDSGSDNTWDNGIDTGNWWSDYNGTGEYAIDGDAHSVDRYPNVLPNGTPSFPLDPVGGFSVEFLILAGGGVIITAIALFILFKRRRIP